MFRKKHLYFVSCATSNFFTFIYTATCRSDKEKSGLQADYEDLMNQIEALKKQKVFIYFARNEHLALAHSNSIYQAL